MSANLWHLTFLSVEEVQYNLENRLRSLEDWSEDKEIPEVLGATLLHACDWGNDGKYDPRGSTRSREAIAVAIVPDAGATIGRKKLEKPATEEPHLRKPMTRSSRLRSATSQSRIGSRDLPNYIGKQNHHCSKRKIRTTHELHNQQREDDFTAPLRNRTNEQRKKQGKELEKHM